MPIFKNTKLRHFGRASVRIRGDGLILLMFLGKDRETPLAVHHEASEYGSWNGAADILLHKLSSQGVQQGQLLSLDAHNTGPDEAARFSAQYSSSLPGHGPLRLQ